MMMIPSSSFENVRSSDDGMMDSSSTTRKGGTFWSSLCVLLLAILMSTSRKNQNNNNMKKQFSCLQQLLEQLLNNLKSSINNLIPVQQPVPNVNHRLHLDQHLTSFSIDPVMNPSTSSTTLPGVKTLADPTGVYGPAKDALLTNDDDFITRPSTSLIHQAKNEAQLKVIRVLMEKLMKTSQSSGNTHLNGITNMGHVNQRLTLKI